MSRKLVLVVGAIVCIGVGLTAGYAAWGQQPFVIKQDSFMLTVHNEESQEYRDFLTYSDELYVKYGEESLQHMQMPFNMAGWYFDKVALQGGEDITVQLTSEQNLTLEEVKLDYRGFPKMVHIGVGAPAGSGMSLDEAKRQRVSYRVTDRNGQRELDLVLTTGAAGDYLLWVENQASTECWCRYAVMVK